MRDREGRKDEGCEQHPGSLQKLEKQRNILDFEVVLGETAFQVMKYKEMVEFNWFLCPSLRKFLRAVKEELRNPRKWKLPLF